MGEPVLINFKLLLPSFSWMNEGTLM